MQCLSLSHFLMFVCYNLINVFQNLQRKHIFITAKIFHLWVYYVCKGRTELWPDTRKNGHLSLVESYKQHRLKVQLDPILNAHAQEYLLAPVKSLYFFFHNQGSRRWALPWGCFNNINVFLYCYVQLSWILFLMEMSKAFLYLQIEV